MKYYNAITKSLDDVRVEIAHTGVSSMIDLITKSLDGVRAEIARINPAHTWVLYSGGNDSAVLTHLIMSAGLADGVLHLDTGTGIPETQAHVRRTAKRHGWRLEIERTPIDYEELVLEHGFPGPAVHHIMMTRLKMRALAAFKRRTGPRQTWLLFSGVRQSESVRRMGYDSPSTYAQRFHWFSAIFKWSKSNCREYMRRHELVENPVSALLGMSGECLCGAYASPGELEMIEQLFPETGQRLRALENRAREAGFPWGWEQGPPSWWTRYQNGQAFLPGLNPPTVAPLCANCDAQNWEPAHE